MGEMNTGISRRGFLQGAGAAALGAAGLGLLGGCAPQAPSGSDKGSAAEAEAPSTDWLGEAPVIDEADVVATHEADVVVVGAGTAGLFAACAAVEEGASCILVEKAGTDAVGNGVRDTLAAVGSSQQLADGANPDKFDVINEMVRQANGYGDDRLYRVWADRSGEAIDWYAARLKEKDTNFLHEIDDLSKPLRFKTYDVGHSIQWEGREYSTTYAAKILLEYGQAKGLECHHETQMLSLVKDESGRVSGLHAKTKDGVVRYNAKKGVIVCAGGYASNPDMLEALQPETVKMIGTNKAFPSVTGDGIKACLWAGGVMDETHAAMIFDRAAVPPDATDASAGDLFWMGSQPFLKVDLDGNRFTNESGCYDHILHTSFNLKDQTYCTVWDSNYQADIEHFDTHGCSRIFPHMNGTEPVMPMFVIEGMNQGLMEKGYIVSSDTVEGLAKELNIPADAFAATVARYNELADAGEDSDFGKEAHRLSHLDTPPFFGVRQHGGYFITTLDGIKIDANMNVVDEQGAPIPGLYCAGDCSGGYFGNSYVNLLSGAAAGRSVTFGRLAGQNAAHGA
ncbi:FAD-dependent oxidoreductase [Arabiibacter massiliensis]|uniref:FAD-dependent oxidoreductase n=1 Tax=Arabiibacter massiliensis TaxID=1870985 RepID=UPI0009B9A192|nr:FAD-dependent oxidoreductase [Arabiibacter massiliensis]